ncbi:MAG: ATP-binding protein [Gemmatimonadetes bacterium]|nr:ATP-binding protein [Gemmatimonadota bacterium]
MSKDSDSMVRDDDGSGIQPAEDEKRVKTRRFIWEACAVGFIAALGAWLADPAWGWAIAAAVLSTTTVVLAARMSRPARVAASVLGLAGSGAALHTSWQVGAIEERWPQVRESLIRLAERRLGSTLADAVATVEALADRGAGLAMTSREAAFAALESGLAVRSPEQGVVVFGQSGEPWAWAGNLRIPVAPMGTSLRVRFTPFYVVLEAERTENGRSAVAQVVLAADSAVPNRDATVAVRFARVTGSELQFLEPSSSLGGDAFDYCVPECDPADVVPDTLFSVVPVPPAQGTLKLRVLERGGRRVAVAAALALAVLFVVAGPRMRLLTVAGFAGLLVLTPFGSRLWLGPVFSSRTYFLAELGPLSASAGDLLISAALTLTLVAVVWNRCLRGWTLVGPLAGVLVVVTPLVLRELARGVTVPDVGIGVSTWLGWCAAIGLVGTALLALAALVVRLSGAVPYGPRATWIALGWGFVLVAAGLQLWTPGEPWPLWYLVLWLPALLMAVRSSGRARVFLSSAWVVGGLAVLLVWGEEVDGRLLNAERDIRRVGERLDPVALGALEAFAIELELDSVPLTAADLYTRWLHSSLSRDDYPVSLATWNGDGEQIARLDLASLELPQSVIRTAALRVAGADSAMLEEYTLLPGVHHLLVVPFSGRRVVTAVVGPRTRAIQPVRVARFLRGERQVGAGWDVLVSDREVSSSAAGRLPWERRGADVVGERSLTLPGGARSVQVRVALGGSIDLLVRGTLMVGFISFLAMLCWLLAEVMQGHVAVDSRFFGRLVKGGSYRNRLTLALAVFFFVPTVVFASWSVARLRAEVRASRDLVIGQTLQDAAGAGLEFAVMGERIGERLDALADQLDAELLLYQDGQLQYSSARVLAELGIVEPYLPPSIYRQIVLERGLTIEMTANRDIGGRLTRVGYRALNTLADRSTVLAAPRLVEDPRLSHDQLDLFYALLAIILVGFAAASGLATTAGRTLAHPVQALSDAASAIGRGDEPRPFDSGMPAEFVPVVNAFERMAADVTAHEAALKDALNFTGAVLRNVATGVVALGADLRVTTVNPSAVELFGLEPTPDEPIDRQTGPQWEELWAWVWAFVGGHRETDAKEFNIGEKRIRAQVATFLATGERGCVLALDDATELAVAERVLAWGEMARQVAHEIKNPLTPIRLGVQHLQRARQDGREDFDATLEKTSRQILAEIERLDAIARAFSRFGAPPVQTEQLADVDLAATARETASLYTMGGGTSVDVRASGPAVGRVRKDEFKEVLINLIENARGAGATEVTVEIERRGPSQLRLTVRDNGSGISPENLPRIFEPQFSTTTSGTGLGLAICKRLVESWGATIEAQSEAGNGTAFTIRIG